MTGTDVIFLMWSTAPRQTTRLIIGRPTNASCFADLNVVIFALLSNTITLSLLDCSSRIILASLRLVFLTHE